MSEDIEFTITKLLTELQLTKDSSIQAIPLTNEAYKKELNSLDEYLEESSNEWSQKCLSTT